MHYVFFCLIFSHFSDVINAKPGGSRAHWSSYFFAFRDQFFLHIEWSTSWNLSFRMFFVLFEGRTFLVNEHLLERDV